MKRDPNLSKELEDTKDSKGTKAPLDGVQHRTDRARIDMYFFQAPRNL